MNKQPEILSSLAPKEAVELAIELQRMDRLDEARTLYRRVLAVAPQQADALHYAGVLEHQQGDTGNGIALIRRSLELEPDQADWWSNLGILCQLDARLDDAVAAYRRAIELDPGHANAHNNLGALLRLQGDDAGAERAFRAAVHLDAEHDNAYKNLGALLYERKQIPESVECLCKVLALKPSHPEARRLLALAHCIVGQVDEAVAIYERWLEEEPDHPVARHMLAACSGRNVPARAEDTYVEEVFDDFAESFEAKLKRLSYRAPGLIAEAIVDAGFLTSKKLDVLDAGCGTGLCGPLVAPYARTLVGLDLSGGMLEQAARKGVYDELVREELTAFLRTHPSSFDLIVSADTLVYFGSLHEVLSLAAGALRPGGLLAFTLEDAGDESPNAEFRIRYHGRYEHGAAYVQHVLEQARLQVTLARAALRTEAGSPVPGLVIRATKPASGNAAGGTAATATTGTLTKR